MEVIGKTNIGAVRFTNEDSFIINKKDDDNFIAFVCDGMGGHLGGSFASNKTTQILNNKYIETEDLKKPGIWLHETIEEANNQVFEKSREDTSLRGMGTTVTGIIKSGNDIFFAHIGDSRIYVFNQDSISQITTDHTYVNSLVINGVITHKQALKHPKRHVLTNALGIKKELSVDIGQFHLKENEGILICSDGLYNEIEEKNILKVLNAKRSVDEITDALIEKAISCGGNDNITLIVVK